MGVPIGLNIFTWNQETRAVCDALQAPAHLFLDNDGGAAEAAARYPNAKIIARIVDDHTEKHLHETHLETRRYLQMRHGQVDGRCYINLGCEAPTDKLSLLVGETVDALQWAVEHQVKVAAPHGAFYAINPPDFPTLDPLADIIAAHPDLFLFTVDEYSGGHGFSGVVDPSVAGGNEIGHILPEHWKAGPVPSSWRDTQFYHAGRITNYFRYRQAFGKALPLTVITECGMDNLGDIDRWLKSLKNTGTADGVRGWQTLAPQWREWYPHWSGDVTLAEMYAAQQREIYAPWPNILARLHYAHGTAGDPQWNSYRSDGHREFYETLPMMNWKGTAVSVLPKPKPAEATRSVLGLLHPKASTVNVRAAPHTSADVVAVLGQDVPVMLFSGGEVAQGGYDWAWIEWGLPVKGAWMARLWPTWAQQIVKIRTVAKHKKIDVPFNTQNGLGQFNLCMEAVIASLAEYRAWIVDGKTIDISPLEVAALIPDRGIGESTTYQQGIDVAAHYGLTLNLTNIVDSAVMVAQINADLPVIVDYVRNLIPGWRSIYAQDPDGPHLSIVDEYTLYSDGSVEFGIEDPLGFVNRLGDSYPVNALNLLAAMRAKGYANNALLVDPSSLAVSAPPAPPLSLFTVEEEAEINALIDAKIKSVLAFMESQNGGK